MKQLCVGALLLLTAHAGYAQNKNLEGKYAIKLYNTTSWEKDELTAPAGSLIGVSQKKEFKLLHPSFALRLTGKSGNMHELELSRMELGSVKTVDFLTDPSGIIIPQSGGKQTETSIALRYEYTFNFMKKKNSRWMPALGIAVMPYLERFRYTPELSSNYSSTRTTLGARGYVVPRISYAVSSKLFLDLNVPVCITDASAQWDNYKNPNIPSGQQKTSTSNFQGAPQYYSIRIGVGLKV